MAGGGVIRPTAFGDVESAIAERIEEAAVVVVIQGTEGAIVGVPIDDQIIDVRTLRQRGREGRRRGLSILRTAHDFCEAIFRDFHWSDRGVWRGRIGRRRHGGDFVDPTVSDHGGGDRKECRYRNNRYRDIQQYGHVF